MNPISNSNPFLYGPCAHGARVHPDRVVLPLPKPHDAPPGTVPFHRFLQAQNQTERIAQRTTSTEPVRRDRDQVELGSNAKLLPKLGDLPATDAPIKAILHIEQIRQQVVPATGQVLDLYI